MTHPYTQTTCDHCTLGDTMRDCSNCKFYNCMVAEVDADLPAIMEMIRGAERIEQPQELLLIEV